MLVNERKHTLLVKTIAKAHRQLNWIGGRGWGDTDVEADKILVAFVCCISTPTDLMVCAKIVSIGILL